MKKEVLTAFLILSVGMGIGFLCDIFKFPGYTFLKMLSYLLTFFSMYRFGHIVYFRDVYKHRPKIIEFAKQHKGRVRSKHLIQTLNLDEKEIKKLLDKSVMMGLFEIRVVGKKVKTIEYVLKGYKKKIK